MKSKPQSNILFPGESMELLIKAQTPDYEAMRKRGDKWYHFWRPIMWRELTNKELKDITDDNPQ